MNRILISLDTSMWSKNIIVSQLLGANSLKLKLEPRHRQQLKRIHSFCSFKFEAKQKQQQQQQQTKRSESMIFKPTNYANNGLNEIKLLLGNKFQQQQQHHRQQQSATILKKFIVVGGDDDEIIDNFFARNSSQMLPSLRTLRPISLLSRKTIETNIDEDDNNLVFNVVSIDKKRNKKSDSIQNDSKNRVFPISSNISEAKRNISGPLMNIKTHLPYDYESLPSDLNRKNSEYLMNTTPYYRKELIRQEQQQLKPKHHTLGTSSGFSWNHPNYFPNYSRLYQSNGRNDKLFHFLRNDVPQSLRNLCSNSSSSSDSVILKILYYFMMFNSGKKETRCFWNDNEIFVFKFFHCDFFSFISIDSLFNILISFLFENIF